MASREFPNAVEIEKRILSAMMLKEGKVIPDVINILTAEDFYRPHNKIIFSAIVALHDKRIVPDVLSIEEELRRSGELEKVDRTYLFGLIDLEFTTVRAESDAKVIREKSIRRQLINNSLELADEAGDEAISLEDVLDTAGKKILAVTTKGRTTFEKFSNVMGNAFEQIIERRNHRKEILGVPSGLIDVDKITNGWQKSDLILLAARPSMGKTALAMNMGLGAAKKGKTVAIFSLEMSKVQLGNRLISLESGVNSQSLITGNLSRDELNAVADAVCRLEDLKIFIDDTAGIKLLEMRSRARRLKHEHGLDLIIIDYLQLMQGGRQENRQQEISEISRSLKAMARELEVPILALSQLSRNVEMRAEKKPQLSDLRESGSLEQDADIVMFLYRDEYYNRDETENENLAELIFAKNRNGPTTAVSLQFNKEIMRFGDLTRRES